jgi:thiol-disulfide isomerase/thioredoxin
MVGGLVALVAVLAAASAIGVLMRHREGRVRPASRSSTGTVLTAADLGAPLGERATLVQFSAEFCAYCGPTREMLTEVAGSRAGISLVEIDAAERLDLARRLHVYSTPTVLVLGPGGVIARRSAGRPRKAEVLAAVGDLLDEGVAS